MNRKNVSISILLAILPLMSLAPAKAINGTEARQQLGLQPEPVFEVNPDAALPRTVETVEASTPEVAPPKSEPQQTETAPQGNPVPELTAPPPVNQKATPSDGDVESPASGTAPLPPAPPSPKKQSVPSKSSQSSPPASAQPTQTPNPGVKRSPASQQAPVKLSLQPSVISFTSSPLPKTPTALKPIAVAPVKPLPSLSSSEGYARMVPLSKAIASVGAPNLPDTPQRVHIPQSQLTIAFPWGFQQLLEELGQKVALLYPLVNPVAVTSPFGWRVHPISGTPRFHSGIDLGTATGSPVLAAFSGRVVSSSWLGGYGNAIVLEHGQKLRLLYAHLSESLVSPGQFIPQGAVIGLSGSTGNSTGPHLHFEVQRLTSGEWMAVDPGGQLQSAQEHLVKATQQISRFQSLK
jgi:murein DD-endopeptidase MepM/ murein hydrolase activator NlpD